ncbi:hypothetical protein AcV7_006246 [Taiwanofungus camphoratus]|nr:hypothetical protein AcV7_006246 [Antrodia cinnamomea]
MPVAIANKNYFEVLELESDDVGEEEIRVAYKKLALKWHPDRHTTDKEEAQQKFIEVSEAYRALLEECQQRKRGKSGLKSFARHFPWPTSTPSTSSSSSTPPSSSASSSSSASTSSRASSQSSNGDDGFAGPEQKTKLTREKDRHPGESSREGTPSTPTNGSSYPKHDIRGRPTRPHTEHRHQSASSPSESDTHEHAASSHLKSDAHARSPSSHTKGDAQGHSIPLSPKHDAHGHSASPRSSHDAHGHSTSPRSSHDAYEHYAFSHHKRDADQWSDDSGYYHSKYHSSHKRSKLEEDEYDFVDLGTPVHPLRSPRSVGNLTKDWIFPLQVTLEDLYCGAAHHYRITRTLWSGKTQSVKIDINISPGWRKGTRIRVPGVGNERKDGSFQDIVFVVEEAPHPHFTRIEDDLVVLVQVPWADTHSRPYSYSSSDGREIEPDEEVYVHGLDGEEFALPIPRTLVEGADGTRIVGAGMPVRKGGRTIGKGDLVVRWKFVFPEGDKSHHSRWQNLKKAVYRKL